MKILNKLDFQQIAFNYSSDIGFEEFRNLYNKCTAKPCSSLLIDTTLTSENPLRFRLNLLKGIFKLIIVIDNKIRDEKRSYEFKRDASKISVLSSGKTDKYVYATGEEILQVINN